MENWLVKHAYEKIWCQPETDRRWILKPTRLSSQVGETYGMQVQGYSIRLPIKDKWFHVFQIGAMNHKELGIDRILDQWAPLSEVINRYNVMVTVYTEAGRTFPLEYCWIRKQPNGNILICTEMVNQQQDFSDTDLFIRFYNGLFRYTDGYKEDHKSEVVGGIIKDNLDMQAIVNKFTDYRARSGEPIAYVNGYEIDNLTLDTIELWDYVEVVYDGLIDKIQYFRVADLQAFNSELDGKRKYLLHPLKTNNEIRFINDIDISVLKDGKGVYFHQNQSESFRQVTHNDYSILVNRLNGYILDHDDWNDTDELHIKLIHRRSGLDRSLIWEHNRLLELYKLDDGQIIDAMVGMASSLEEWRGSNLEQSTYNRMMAARYPTITNENCTKAYGYNSVSRFAADTPTKTVLDGGEIVAWLPPLLACNCTVYEYDSDGLLLGFYNHSSEVDNRYAVVNSNCELIEAIEGQGGKILDLTYNATDYTCKKDFNYRFYTNKLKSGVPTDEFEDVTGTDAYTIDNTGKVNWNIDLSRRQPIIFCDSNFLAYEHEEDAYDGHIKFSIDHWFEEGGYKPLEFEMETIELWMNRKKLVRDVDYYINWPQVVVTNYAWLLTGEERHKPKITIRARGLAKELMPVKSGYVVDGLISNDGDFDIRDDKVVAINVNGATLHRDDVTFREDRSVAVSPSLNGKPFQIEDPTVPLRALVSENTYVLRDKSRDLDKRVEDYLTAYLPTPVEIVHNPINGKHNLFSPIMNKVIHDMINGHLDLVADEEPYYISTEQFDRVMEPYIWLLDYDPILNDVDLRYCAVLPHDGLTPIELEPLQMAMIERLNDRYLKNVIVLNKMLLVKV